VSRSTSTRDEAFHRMRNTLTATALPAIAWLPSALGAQLTTPSQWRWVTDAPARLVTEQTVTDSAWRFVSMPPGWHVTTGPGALLFDPSYEAKGRFSLEAEIFLFPNPSDQGYGLFAGGHALETDSASGLAFLIRRDGAAAVARIARGDVEFVRPWQPTTAARPHEGAGTVENTLRVSAEADEVFYVVNGDTVAVIPRMPGALEGPFGVRVGAGLNLHISYLDLIQHLAKPPRRQ